MIPSILAKQLEQGIGDYIETTFPMTNEPFKGSMRNFISSKDSVYHEPYIAVRLPFRVASKMPEMFEAIHPKYLPYVHQQKAFERLTGDDGRSTLVATGTGSGKTECFLYPILEYCYQHRGERGIKALIIYPMNALATDQAKRIAELIYESPELKGNVTAGMYVGGQEHTPSRMMSEHSVITDHETLLNSPPDIMMTNYKMLDYLLVRPKDSQLWQDNHPETLKYIAVDELHTFDGAQGTDLACLLRRLKRRLGIYDGFLCCIGTSATMGSRDSNGSIIEYASEIFGEPFERDSVITEDRLSPGEFFLNFSDGGLYTAIEDDTWDDGLPISVGSRYASSTDRRIYERDEGGLKIETIPDGGVFLNRMDDCIYAHDAVYQVLIKVGGDGLNGAVETTVTETYALTDPDLRIKSFMLSKPVPEGKENSVIIFFGGLAWISGRDFEVVAQTISWWDKGFERLDLEVGDELTIVYPTVDSGVI